MISNWRAKGRSLTVREGEQGRLASCGCSGGFDGIEVGERMKGICILGGFGGRDDISVDA